MLEKEHLQEEKTSQLKCAEGAVSHTVDVVGSDLGNATQNNGATFPTPLAVPGTRGGHGQEEYDRA